MIVFLKKQKTPWPKPERVGFGFYEKNLTGEVYYRNRTLNITKKSLTKSEILYLYDLVNKFQAKILDNV